MGLMGEMYLKCSHCGREGERSRDYKQAHALWDDYIRKEKEGVMSTQLPNREYEIQGLKVKDRCPVCLYEEHYCSGQ